MSTKEKKLTYYILSTTVVVLAVLMFGTFHSSDHETEVTAKQSSQNFLDQHLGFIDEDLDLAEEQSTSEALTVSEHSISPHATFYGTLSEAGVPSPMILQIVEAAKMQMDLTKVRVNTEVNLFWAGEDRSQLHSVHIPANVTDNVVIFFDAQKNQWSSRVDSVEIRTENVTFKGRVESSLWQSAKAVNMDDTLVTRMADIFAWQIDFSRELRTGDRWRIVVKKMMAEDKFVGWGPILAAEFVNGDTVYPAIYYKDLAGKGGYFDSEGQSLRKMFLKSPVAFSRITSRFQRQRFHPILKINRPHRGVDYGAAPGTPVQTVGDGVVLSKKHNKTSGNVMHVRHNSKYTTSYHHLKGFASGLKKGSRVTQGQVIGYVGATGLATGPHLHFEFYEDGRFVDPLGVKFPSADPVSVAEMDRFRTAAQQKLQTLPHWDEGEMFETQPSIAVR